MSDFTKENYRSILDGLILIVQRTAEVFSKAQNWYQQNADTINAYLTTFAELSCWFTAVRTMAEAQIVFTGDLSLEFAQEICKSEDVGKTVEQFYTQDNHNELNAVIARCQHEKQGSTYSELFSQIIAAYQMEHYHIACLGMFAVIDGSLSDVSENNKTSYKERLKKIEQKIADKFELNDLEKKLMCIYMSMDNFEKSIFFNHSDFAQNEPNTLNRHWMMHGRTRRAYTKLDFIKTILWLDAIIFLQTKFTEKEEVTET